MLEKFEKKIDKFKEKINKKILGVIIFMCFGFATIYGAEMTNSYIRQKNQSENLYNRSMYELIEYMKNVEVSLAKLQITTTTSLTSRTLADIWRQSNLAADNLSQLPVNNNALNNTSKYLTQVSDFSYSLLKQTINGDKVTDEQNEQIKQIYEQASNLTEVLNNIYGDLNEGRMNWGELTKKGNEELPDATKPINENISNIGKTFEEYEGLIYDGAFSDHILTKEPLGIPKEEVTKEEAQEKIYEIFGKEDVTKLEFVQEIEGRITIYRFNMNLKDSTNNFTIDITKQGNKVYSMISDRNVSEIKITNEEAINAGLEFMKKLGIESMESTYYLITDNMITINYAYSQDGVIMYPDLVKVKIALDNNEICSIETQGYIFNHQKRDLPVLNSSINKASKVLNKNIEIISQGLAVIPTESKDEVLTYEFKGKIDERDYIVYINAKTLKEERVMLIINTPGGTLTM